MANKGRDLENFQNLCDKSDVFNRDGKVYEVDKIQVFLDVLGEGAKKIMIACSEHFHIIDPSYKLLDHDYTKIMTVRS